MTTVFRALRPKVFELCGQSKYEDAISLCQTKIGKARNEKERVSISLLIPYILECEGRFSESKELLQSIIAENESNRGAVYDLLLVLFDLGDFKQAIVTADQLIELDAKFRFQPFTSSAYFHKAYAAWKLRRFKQAKAALDKSNEKGSIWIDGNLLSRKQLASNISRRKAPTHPSKRKP